MTNNRQILLTPERELLETLTREYDAGLLFFHPYSESWCVVARNRNNIIATFSQHMFTLCIGDIYCIDDLLHSIPDKVDFSTLNKYTDPPYIESSQPITSGIGRIDKSPHPVSNSTIIPCRSNIQEGGTKCSQEKK